MMLAVLIYAYANGHRSSRKVSDCAGATWASG
jgi:hypothetical protein